MKKNLLLRLCLMMSVILALNSCISDDLSSQENPTQDASSFQIFSNRNSQHTQRGSSGSLYYQEAFRDLYFSYYRDHPEEAPDVKDPESFYIDFSRASQVLMGEDSTRYVIFPFMKGLEVKYVVACSVSSKHDYVSFYFPEENEIVKKCHCRIFTYV
ncbi:hypothetical protein ACFQO9_14965 [Chryseobacterium zhengzhouense]|uniref:Lipoprotein n=1 Tax=Chryseobacterium zhengzhouense TaxID=1636086 RepID=A0ABW2M3K5_9FLAO